MAVSAHFGGLYTFESKAVCDAAVIRQSLCGRLGIPSPLSRRLGGACGRSTLDHLPPLQFPFDGLANEIGSVLLVAQDSLNLSERSAREARLHVFGPSPFAAHITTPDMNSLVNLVFLILVIE